MSPEEQAQIEQQARLFELMILEDRLPFASGKEEKLYRELVRALIAQRRKELEKR